MILRRAAFTLVELLVVIAIISILIALLLPAIQMARESARRSQCQNNLKQVGVALHGYHAQREALPPGLMLHALQGRPSASWRALLLPMLEQAPLYDDIGVIEDPADSNYGGVRNRKPGTYDMSFYLCPSASRPEGQFKESHYAGVAGSAGAEDSWDLEDRLCGDVQRDGVLYPGSRVSMADISDGTSHTLAVGERTYIFRDWLVGGDWRGSDSEYTQVCMGSTKNIRYPLNASHDHLGYCVMDTQAPAGGNEIDVAQRPGVCQPSSGWRAIPVCRWFGAVARRVHRPAHTLRPFVAQRARGGRPLNSLWCQARQQLITQLDGSCRFAWPCLLEL